MTTLVIIFLSSVATLFATLGALWWKLHGHMRRFNGDVNYSLAKIQPGQERIDET